MSATSSSSGDVLRAARARALNISTRVDGEFGPAKLTLPGGVPMPFGIVLDSGKLPIVGPKIMSEERLAALGEAARANVKARKQAEERKAKKAGALATRKDMLQRIHQLEDNQREAGELSGAKWAQTLEQAKMSLARSIADEMSSSDDEQPSVAAITRPAPIIRGPSAPNVSGKKLGYRGGSRSTALPSSNARRKPGGETSRKSFH